MLKRVLIWIAFTKKGGTCYCTISELLNTLSHKQFLETLQHPVGCLYSCICSRLSAVHVGVAQADIRLGDGYRILFIGKQTSTCHLWSFCGWSVFVWSPRLCGLWGHQWILYHLGSFNLMKIVWTSETISVISCIAVQYWVEIFFVVKTINLIKQWLAADILVLLNYRGLPIRSSHSVIQT